MKFISAAQLWNRWNCCTFDPQRNWAGYELNPICPAVVCLSVRSSGFLSVAHECLSETCWLAQGDGIRFYAMLLWHHRSQFKKMTCPDLCFIFARRRPQSSSTIFFFLLLIFLPFGITFFTLSTPKTLIILEDKLCVLCFEVTSSAIIDF